MNRRTWEELGIAAIIIELIRHHRRDTRRNHSMRTAVILLVAAFLLLFVASHIVLVLLIAAIASATTYAVTMKRHMRSQRVARYTIRSARYRPEIPYRSEAGKTQYENYQDRETEKAYRRLHGDDDDETPF